MDIYKARNTPFEVYLTENAILPFERECLELITLVRNGDFGTGNMEHKMMDFIGADSYRRLYVATYVRRTAPEDSILFTWSHHTLLRELAYLHRKADKWDRDALLYLYRTFAEDESLRREFAAAAKYGRETWEGRARNAVRRLREGPQI